MLNFISCKARSASLAMILIAGLTGCATESHQALETAKPASATAASWVRRRSEHPHA